jgi:hypothetical protein
VDVIYSLLGYSPASETQTPGNNPEECILQKLIGFHFISLSILMLFLLLLMQMDQHLVLKHIKFMFIHYFETPSRYLHIEIFSSVCGDET